MRIWRRVRSLRAAIFGRAHVESEQGARLSLAGVVFGLAGAWGATRLLDSFLYGVSALDPLTFGCVALFFPAVTIAAAWIPARRAMRVDPMVALRHE